MVRYQAKIYRLLKDTGPFQIARDRNESKVSAQGDQRGGECCEGADWYGAQQKMERVLTLLSLWEYKSCEGRVAEWLCRGLQILVRWFDSGPGLQNFPLKFT